jgi:hypothetical protein
MEKSFWQSKKFWATIVGIITPVLNRKFNLGLTETDLLIIIGAIVGYNVGQGFADAGR